MEATSGNLLIYFLSFCVVFLDNHWTFMSQKTFQQISSSLDIAYWHHPCLWSMTVKRRRELTAHDNTVPDAHLPGKWHHSPTNLNGNLLCKSIFSYLWLCICFKDYTDPADPFLSQATILILYSKCVLSLLEHFTVDFFYKTWPSQCFLFTRVCVFFEWVLFTLIFWFLLTHT